MVSLKEEYTRLVADKLTISVDDFTADEKRIIDVGFKLLLEKIEELAELNRYVYRLETEIKNLKAMHDI